MPASEDKVAGPLVHSPGIRGVRAPWPAVLALVLLAGAFPAAGGDNLLQNGGFEQQRSGTTPMWTTEAWVYNNDAVRFLSTDQLRHSGGRSLAIVNLQPNDSRAVQWVKVKPGTYYRLSCWIYAQEVSTEAVGANISAAGTTAGGGNLTETGGRWVQVEMYGRTEADQDSLGVQVRLGFYGSLATGLALFDDVRLEELPGPPGGVPPGQIVNLGAVEKQASIVAAEQPVVVRPRPLNPWLLAALLAALAAGVLALLGLQLGGRLRARLRRWKLRPKVTILDLVYGPGTPGGRSAGGDAESSRRGRRSREGLRVEHRRCPRAPFAAEVTVRRIHPNGRLEALRLRAGNISDGGLFLLCADAAALRLDEEVSLELAGAELPVDLGRAVVVRVHWLSGRVCGGFGLRFLWPSWRIHRLRQGLPASFSRLPAPRSRKALPAPAAE